MQAKEKELGSEPSSQNEGDQTSGKTTSSQAQTDAVVNSKTFIPMRKEAFHGLAGNVVRIAAPVTEACPEAILLHFIISIGNIVGRDIFINQGQFNRLNEFTCLVGESSTGAKGTSSDVIRSLMALA